MHYSLNEIIARLYLKNYLGQDKNISWKVKLLEELFGEDDNFYKAPDGFFNGNYLRKKTVDIPPLTHHNVATPIYDSFNNDNINNGYVKKLFENLNNLWNRLHPNTRELLFEHRRDIFGDFRYDSVNDRTLDKLDNDLPKNIENLLELESEKAFIYAILLFILIAIFHENIAVDPVSVVFKKETIEGILEIEFSKNEISSSISNISNEYDQPFGHQQYKNFKIYLYNDTGNYTSDFCSGEIHFRDNGEVNLNFQNEKSMGTTQYSGKAYLFTANKLVHITLEDETTHRGALICFHYTEFKKDPKKCFLRKGLFISTGAADEHYRPYVKNIILLHKEPTQQEFVSGLLKCCNMRNGKEFIIIQKTAVTHFINRLYEFAFMIPLIDSKSFFEQFFDRHEHNNYCLIKENEFLDFLIENFNSSLDEWNHIEIILLLKSFSELPNAIYPYATPDPTFHIFL